MYYSWSPIVAKLLKQIFILWLYTLMFRACIFSEGERDVLGKILICWRCCDILKSYSDWSSVYWYWIGGTCTCYRTTLLYCAVVQYCFTTLQFSTSVVYCIQFKAVCSHCIKDICSNKGACMWCVAPWPSCSYCTVCCIVCSIVVLVLDLAHYIACQNIISNTVCSVL